MSMWADYFKEKDGKEAVETEKGFMLYLIRGDECYIEQVYIKPEFRKSGEGKYLLSVVEGRAKKAGCKFVTGSVRPSANGATDSAKALFAVGFKIHSSAQDAIIFIKGVDNG